MNRKKRISLSLFLAEYRRVGQIFIDYIWKEGIGDFVPSEDKLSLPKYLNYKELQKNTSIETSLSARALNALATQVCAMLSASTEKRRKCLWMREKLIKEGSPVTLLNKKLGRNWKLVKPRADNIRLELSSNCARIQKSNGKFNYFLQLKSLGKSYGKIRIPILWNAVSKKWQERGGMLMTSFLISDKCVNLRFKIEDSEKTDKIGGIDGIIVGCDQGMKTVATFSDGQTTPEKDVHGHSLYSVISKLARKRKGSKAFKKAQAHRENFIHASLNTINFKGFSEIRLEKIRNINYKKKTSRLMSGWTNTLIRDKIKSLAEEAEVPLILQDSSYASQRCSCCGLVRKANRKKKSYECKNCGHSMDADLNASLNHSFGLPPVDYRLRGKKLNLGKGFFWKHEGLFNFDGSELRVPDSDKKE